MHRSHVVHLVKEGGVHRTACEPFSDISQGVWYCKYGYFLLYLAYFESYFLFSLRGRFYWKTCLKS